jgi:hypothetical protein
LRARIRALAAGVLLAGSLVAASTPAAAASYPASYFAVLPMNVPVPYCISTAEEALLAAGVSVTPPASNAITVGGVTSTTRGYVVCVQRPDDGICGLDGSTAVIVTAGADAKTLVNQIAANFKPPQGGCL